ncbi:MAG: S8 family serine peptidase, partial [Oscillospiraceae bacterium]|nr:S8 family serine peptidase [Oscillospiraceae bacterium]
MLNKKARRPLGIILALAMALAFVPNVSAASVRAAGKPAMQYAGGRRPHGGVSLPDSRKFLDEPAVFDTMPEMPDEHETGKTDRYIVKYRPGREETITLNEELSPEEFAAEVSLSGASSDIEYIQPDYELSLDNFGLVRIDGSDDMQESDEELTDEAPEQDGAAPDDEPDGDEDQDQAEDEEVVEVEEETEIAEEEIAEEEIAEEETEEEITEEEEEPDAEDAAPVVVAVIDTGFDTGHEVFDGYLHEMAEDTPTDLLSYAHGTHVGGIIAQTARSVDAEIKLLPIRVFENGTAYTSDVIAAIEYAISCGAQIINCSFGSPEENTALYEAIAGADALFVCAVGNNRRDFDNAPSYPAGYDLPNIISVASTNADDGFSYYSNYGAGSIDIAALGRDVHSALPGNQYGTMTGTSMSAAFITGVAASLLALGESGGENSAENLKEQIVASADMLSNLQTKVLDGRRANLVNALTGTVPDGVLQVNPEDDFDVHGYQRTEEEQWSLYSAAGGIVQVAGGAYHTLALKENGTVWGWGTNSMGQLGNGEIGSLEEKLTQVIGLTDIIAIATKDNHSLALKSDGTVWAWGFNNNGQLGDGTTANRTAPVQVSGLTGIASIAAGYSHSYAVKSNGTVYAWGSNYYGQLGDGTNTNRKNPVLLSGLADVATVDAGNRHGIALKSNGTVWTWGNNAYGQLGDGTATDRPAPAQIEDLTGITAIASFNNHSLALQSDGTVWAWGYNVYGQLGDGTRTNKTAPVQVDDIAGAAAIAAGYDHSLALKADGTVWAWGHNMYGQLGDGSRSARYAPVQASGIDDSVGISAGYNHSLAITSDGTVWAWGSNSHGQLGARGIIYQRSPVKLPSLDSVASISAGEFHVLALKTDGTVWSWGGNSEGQLGDGTAGKRTAPAQIDAVTDAVAVAAGGRHSLALKSDGTVWQWGFGQLTPTLVSGLTDVVEVAAGYDHCLALKSDGTVWSWGENGWGQLGIGTMGVYTNQEEPIQVSGLTGVTSISCGIYEQSAAVKSDGTVWVWGLVIWGYYTQPTQVDGLTGAVSVEIGETHYLARMGDGSVWGWGESYSGQVGTGYASYYALPTETDISDVTSISAGLYHSAAVKSDGTVWAWGNNTYGQMGDNTSIERLEPQQVGAIANAVSVSASWASNFAVDEDGDVWGWGYNGESLLTLPYLAYSAAPVHAITEESANNAHGESVFDFDAEIEFDVALDQEVHIAVTGSAVTSFDGVDITVSFDPAYLELVDAAAQTPGANVAE